MPAQPLQISYSLSNISNIAHQLWQYGNQFSVWVFRGEMGAGKTSLIHAICDLLGVKDTVSSPTFALINEYHFTENQEDKIIYHMDWYRLKDADEARDAGMEDLLMQQGIYCFVEWPEKASELLPQHYLNINLKFVSETERQITAMGI